MTSDLRTSVVDSLTARWWAVVLRGVAAIVFGILAFTVPKASLLALVLVWGAYAVVDGVLSMVLAAQRGRAGLRWGWFLVEGIVGVAAGLFTFIWPAFTASVLVFVIAAWAILTGIAEVGAAIRLRQLITHEWLMAAGGLLSIVFGVLLMVYPRTGAVAIMWLIGAYAIVFGILLVGLGLRLNRLRHAGPRPFPTGGLPATS
jgi:uncharacterized membrane protein HdeD (DUF308 family)